MFRRSEWWAPRAVPGDGYSHQISGIRRAL